MRRFRASLAAGRGPMVGSKFFVLDDSSGNYESLAFKFKAPRLIGTCVPSAKLTPPYVRYHEYMHVDV